MVDKIFSTRLEEAIIQQFNRLSRVLKVSKKKLLEDMILERARQLDTVTEKDIWSETSGSWSRKEGAREIQSKIRTKFETGMKRHHIK